MTVVRPKLLGNTAEQAGYDNLDPISQWFLGGTATAGAEATGLDDDDRFGLDLLNVGAGGKALRATSGNGLRSIVVNNTAVSITGLAVTGSTVFSSPVTMLSTLDVTGVATFWSSATVGGNLLVHGTLNVTGAATFTSDLECLNLEVNNDVSVDRDLSVDRNVDIDGDLDVDGDSFLQVVRLIPDPGTANSLLIQNNATQTSVWALGVSSSTAPNFQIHNIVGTAVSEFFEITETGRVNIRSLEVYSGSIIVSAGGLSVTGTSAFGNAAEFNDEVQIDGTLTCDGGIEIDAGGLVVNGSATFHDPVLFNDNVGFFGSTPSSKETVTGSRDGNVALGNLLDALANYGLVSDSTSS